MQIAQFVCVDLDSGWVVEFQKLLQCTEVDIVCRINGLSSAEDTVCNWYPAAEQRRIFDVIYTAEGGLGQLEPATTWRRTYSSDAVCSMPTTLVIIARLSTGTFSHALKAAMSCFRMSFPG